MDAYRLLPRLIVIWTALLIFRAENLFHSSGLVFAAEKLSVGGITLALDTYDRFAELMIRKAGARKDKAKEDFAALFARLSVAIDEAEKQACTEKGIKRERYQSILDRVIMVKTYITYKEMRDRLETDIRKRETMTEADLDREAQKRYQEMEAWYDRVGGNLTLEDVKKERDEKLKQYLDSIAEQNRRIDEYNRKLPPNRKLVNIQQQISLRQARLTDPRFRAFKHEIERDIAQLEKIAARIAARDKRRKKSKKKPDPLVLNKINAPVDTYHAKKQNNFYTTLMQGIRARKASGQWRQTVKDNNRKKILELRLSVKRLDALLSDSRLRQAAVDANIVNQVVDRARLMALSPLPWQHIPDFP